MFLVVRHNSDFNLRIMTLFHREKNLEKTQEEREWLLGSGAG